MPHLTMFFSVFELIAKYEEPGSPELGEDTVSGFYVVGESLLLMASENSPKY